jgi:hypothetical protein
LFLTSKKSKNLFFNIFDKMLFGDNFCNIAKHVL